MINPLSLHANSYDCQVAALRASFTPLAQTWTTKGNGVVRLGSLVPSFTPLRRLARVMTQIGAWSEKLHFYSTDSEAATVYA